MVRLKYKGYWVALIVFCIVNNRAYGFTIVGHCGAAGHAPENTRASFGKALEIGVNAIELDICACKSGELVTIHDLTLNRTTNGQGFVCKKTYTQLRKLNAGNGETIPMLEEALDFINRKAQVLINVRAGTAQAVSTIINKYVQHKQWQYQDFCVISSEPQELALLKKLCPQVKLGACFDALSFTAGTTKFSPVNVDIYIARFYLISPEDIKRTHDSNKKIYAGMYYDATSPITNRVEYLNMMKLGVDGIISHYPEITKAMYEVHANGSDLDASAKRAF